MSPSRRRAIGAVRGLASRAHSCSLAVDHRRALPERRDARPPGLPARAAIYPRALPERRDGDIAPYRNYAPFPRLPPFRPSRAPRSCPVAVGRDAWPPPPVGAPHLSARAAIYPRALPGRRDGDIAPYRHYAPFPRLPPFRPIACSTLVSRCGRARCLAAPGSRRRACARGGSIPQNR